MNNDKVVRLGSYLTATAGHSTDGNNQTCLHAVRASLKKQHGTNFCRQEQYWVVSTRLTELQNLHVARVQVM